MTNNRLCPHCKGFGLISQMDPDDYFLVTNLIDLNLNMGDICHKCNGTGLKRRI